MSTARTFVRHEPDSGELLADASRPLPGYEHALVELPSSQGALAAARAWASAAAPARALTPGERQDVLLLLDELVANAVRHAPARGPADTVTVALGVARARLRIEVCDRGAGFSVGDLRPAGAGASGGRGLLLVDALATRWGTSRGARHCVWIELRRLRDHR